MQATFTTAGMKRGARAVASVSLFVIPFGIAFAVAAQQAGLSLPMTVFMSATVFAGASQFAALQLWGESIPLIPLVIIIFAVNARHILMGATLYPWMSSLPWSTRLGAMVLLTDANYALAIPAHEKGEWDLGYLFGGGMLLWVNWLIGTFIGAAFGAAMGDPRALGLDVVMVTFFSALLAASWKGKATLYPWVVAGIASLLAYHYLPANWHVIVGAFAGGVAGVLRRD